ncbi:Uracil-DNA glycosylase, family 4 [Minicystis rosea]|nr:Uracil-DNA glycosylase, family 4 [Minicystis rosea]
MELVPLCPFEVGAFLWEAQPGQSSLTIVVKGTFTLAPGELRVAPAQDPLAEERHLDDNALASLHWPGDFAPVKRKVDVTLVGHAYAPGGHAIDSLEARLSVGDLRKTVRVSGDRTWTRDASLQLVPSAPAPFVRMPLRYERAALSADNPAGFDRNLEAKAGAPALPNLERVEGSGIPCFGPISPQWRSRRRVLDEASMFWAYGVARAPREDAPPIGPAPPRFDFAFFNAAPPDQQIDLLRAGAPIVLDHLHPDHPRLEARVPAMRPQVFRVPPQGRVEEIILRCDTLWIDTDRSVVVLTWRGLAEAPNGADGVGTLVMDADPEGKKLRWERVEKSLAEVRPPTLRLPSGGVSVQPKPRIPAASSGPDPLAVRYDGRGRPPEGPPSGREIVPTQALGPSGFIPDEGPAAPVNPVVPAIQERPAPAIDLHRKAIPAATPPTPVAPPTPIVPVAPPAAPAPTPPAPAVTEGDGAPTEPIRPAPRPVPPPKMAAPPVAPEGPAPVRPLMVLGGTPRPSPGRPPPPVEAQGQLQKPVRPVIPRDAGPALRKDIDVQRYGTIAAELAHKGESRAAVLKAHLLTEPAWSLVDQHWKKAIAQETEEGGRTLLLAFDEAYLATQQRLGKPVGVLEYARIQVGIERGEVGRALAELSLELGDLMRLQRVWTKRLADSPDLAADLDRAVEDARRNMV